MIRVSDIMTKDVTCIDPSLSFADIWKLIFRQKINALPVVGRKNHLTGILTKEDLLKPLYPEFAESVESLMLEDISESEDKLKDVLKLKARDVMHPVVIYVRESTPAMRALARMIARSVHQLPVLDDRDYVVGMITKGDIFYALYRIKRTDFTVRSRPTPALSQVAPKPRRKKH